MLEVCSIITGTQLGANEGRLILYLPCFPMEPTLEIIKITVNFLLLK
jgi:hypothetical protein